MVGQAGVLIMGTLISPWVGVSEVWAGVGTGAIPITGIIHITIGALHVIIADFMDIGGITLIGIMDLEIIIMAGDPGFLQLMAMETGIWEVLYPRPLRIKQEIIMELLPEKIHGVQ